MGLFSSLFGPRMDMSAEALKAQDCAVIDVRTGGEFRTGHVAGAVNIDIHAADFSKRIGRLKSDQLHVVYCQSGARASSAVRLMKAQGLNAVSGGGINTMIRKGWQLGR